MGTFKKIYKLNCFVSYQLPIFGFPIFTKNIMVKMIVCTTALFFWGNFGVCLSLFIIGYKELFRRFSLAIHSSRPPCVHVVVSSRFLSHLTRGAETDQWGLLLGCLVPQECEIKNLMNRWHPGHQTFSVTLTSDPIGRRTFCISVWWQFSLPAWRI